MPDARSAFVATGPSVFVPAHSTALNGVLVTPTDTSPALHGSQFRVVSASTNTIVHFAYAATNTDAANAAVAATNGTTQSSIPIHANTTIIITAPRGMYWTGNSTVNTNLFITPGYGL